MSENVGRKFAWNTFGMIIMLTGFMKHYIHCKSGHKDCSKQGLSSIETLQVIRSDHFAWEKSNEKVERVRISSTIIEETEVIKHDTCQFFAFIIRKRRSANREARSVFREEKSISI